jgi:hypothetical protein
MRQAIAASNVVHLEHPEHKSLSWQEVYKKNKNRVETFYLFFFQAFYLATVGGSQVIGMQDKLGNFQPGISLSTPFSLSSFYDFTLSFSLLPLAPFTSKI